MNLDAFEEIIRTEYFAAQDMMMKDTGRYEYWSGRANLCKQLMKYIQKERLGDEHGISSTAH